MDWDTPTTEEFLLTIKHYIECGHMRFVKRKGRDSFQDLMDLGITSMEQMWQEILFLRIRDEYKPPEPDHNAPDSLVWFFTKELNGKMAYIKLKFEAERGAVCLSFHP